MPVPHHSVFTGQMSFLLPNQQRQNTEGRLYIFIVTLSLCCLFQNACCDVDVETPLTLAAMYPRPRRLMIALVSEGAFLDFRNRRGLTAMHVAADYGNRDAVRVS